VDEKEADLLLRGLLQNKGFMKKKERIIFETNSTFFTAQLCGFVGNMGSIKHVDQPKSDFRQDQLA